jgi:hypothetical protein
MKHLDITFLEVSAFAVGCTPAAEMSVVQYHRAAADKVDKVKTEAKEATHEIKEHAYTERAEFVPEVQRHLDQIKGLLDGLYAKVERSSEVTRAEAKPKLKALRDQAARLNKQLDGTKSATESTWGDVKAGFEKEYDELKDGFQQARQWASDKIAP